MPQTNNRSKKSGIIATILAWLALSRWREWIQSKLLFTAAIALLIAPISFKSLLAIITVIPWAAFGYGINEIADQHCDQLAGKRNRAALISPISQLLFLILTASTTLALTISWAADYHALIIVIAGLLLAAIYSLPPIRLKERAIWGLLAAAVAQWGLPVLAIATVSIDNWRNINNSLASLLGVAIGMRWMAVHQWHDLKADQQAGVQTFATSGGQLSPLIVGAFIAELILLTFLLICSWPRSMPAIIALAKWLINRVLIGFSSGSLKAALHTYRNAPLAEYYFLLWPLSLSLMLGYNNARLFVISALLLILGGHHLGQLIREWLFNKQTMPTIDRLPPTRSHSSRER